MLQNIRCFIVYIVVIVLGSCRKEDIVFSFFVLGYEVEKNLPFNAVKLDFVTIFVFFVTAASFIEIISFKCRRRNGKPTCFSSAAWR